jgi:hypothetical protein
MSKSKTPEEPMEKFNVTYEIMTEESAEYGDADERGFIAEGVNLRDAIEAVRQTRTCHVDSALAIEPSECPGNSFRWITINNGMEYLTGAYESRSLHIPDAVTPSSRKRILRLLIG